VSSSSASSLTLSSPLAQEKKKRGRKPTIDLVDDDIKARLTVMVAKLNVSLRNADAIAYLWMSKYKDAKKYQDMGLSRHTIHNILMDVYGRTLKYLCLQIVRSKKLTVLIDGTTDRKQRSPLAILMTGIDPENYDEKWFVFSFPHANFSLHNILTEIYLLGHTLFPLLSQATTQVKHNVNSLQTCWMI
jgi:hypothetical protein